MTPNANRLLRTVDEMLADVGQSHANELRSALVALGSFATLPAPAPGAELKALMAVPHGQLARLRRLSRHRPTVIGLAVIAGMGLGATGVAATAPLHGQSASGSIQTLLQGWAPSWAITEVPSASAAGYSLPGPQPETPSLAFVPGGSGPTAAVSATEAVQATDVPGAAANHPVPAGHGAAETARGLDVAQSRKAQDTTSRETERAADRVAREFGMAQELSAGQWLKKFNH